MGVEVSDRVRRGAVTGLPEGLRNGMGVGLSMGIAGGSSSGWRGGAMMGLMHGAERFLAQGVSTGCWWVCVMALPRMRVWACGGLFTRHHRGVTEAGGAGRRRVVSGILYRL